MKSKEEIAGDYMSEMKLKHANKGVPAFDRTAFIVGSDGQRNIGAAVARSLRDRPDFKVVQERDAHNFNVYDWNIDQFREWTPDVLVIAAGYSYMDWIEDLPDDQLTTTIDVNLTGVIRTVQAYVKAMINAPRRKHIVIIGSMAYRSVLNASAAYCAAKAGVAMFARCAAWELAPKGFDVFCIHPSNDDCQ